MMEQNENDPDNSVSDRGPLDRRSFFAELRYALSIYPTSFNRDAGPEFDQIRLATSRMLLAVVTDAERMRHNLHEVVDTTLKAPLAWQELRVQLEVDALTKTVYARRKFEVWKAKLTTKVEVGGGSSSANRIQLSPLEAMRSASLTLQSKPLTLGGNMSLYDASFYGSENKFLEKPFVRPGQYEFLWSNSETSEPEPNSGDALQLSARKFIEQKPALGADPWAYWRQLYQLLLKHQPLDLQLCDSVLKIDETIWEEGVEAVAEEIAAIEARLKPDPLPDAEALGLAQKIAAKPEAAILAADGLAQLIEMATQEYKREISNALPEELEPLDNLPMILNNLSLILTSSKPNTDKEARLQAALELTASTVFDLNRRLKAAASKLESLQRNGKGRRLFADAFYEKAGERSAELITSKVLWGGLMTGAGFLLGGGSAEALTNGVQECFQGIIQPEAIHATNPSMKPK